MGYIRVKPAIFIIFTIIIQYNFIDLLFYELNLINIIYILPLPRLTPRSAARFPRKFEPRSAAEWAKVER